MNTPNTARQGRYWALYLCLSLSLVGCQVGRGTSNIDDQISSDAQSFDGSSSTDAGILADVSLGQGPGAGTMSGTWLLYHERSSCLLGQEQLTHATYLIDIDQKGSTLIETRRLCGTQLSAVLGMNVRIPEAVLKGIKFIPVDRGMISTLREGGTYISSTELGLWGLDLENPATDVIPEAADAPEIVDSDHDGNPAVTFKVGSDCERYQAQRQILTYFGTFTTPNQIDGHSAGVTDMVVYGGSDGFCTIAPPVESNDAASRFRMVRVDGKGGSVDADFNQDATISCAEALVLAPKVLEERPPDPENCK